jgi:hypothetical protein
MRTNGYPPHPRVIVQGVERSFGSGDTVVRVLRGVDLVALPGERVARPAAAKLPCST